VECAARVKFTDARILDKFDLRNAFFKEEVNFLGAEFPDASFNRDGSPNDGLLWDGVEFERGFNLEWSQIKGKISVGTPSSLKATWSNIQAAFHRLGDLDGENQARFERSVLDVRSAKGWRWMTGCLNQWYWGFGLRPWRLAWWMLVTFLLFASFYWKQIDMDAPHGSGDLLVSIRGALTFTWRSSWNLYYGFEHSSTRLCKSITLLNQVILKAMLVCLVQAIANVSPPIHEVFGKFLPI
jgi:hypothetical protein